MQDHHKPAAGADQPVNIDQDADAGRRAFLAVDPDPSDPRAKEAALRRLRDAPDEQLAVFADKLRDDARDAGASERDVRDAETGHPERE